MIDARTAGLVAFGAMLGATIRWSLSEAFDSSTAWPWATFTANIVGALALGAVLEARHRRVDEATSDPVRLLVGTGLCGALTTFSTFAVEVATLGRDDRAGLGVAYLLASVAVGVAAVLVGRRLTGLTASKGAA